MVKLRLQRFGSKKRPFYRIVDGQKESIFSPEEIMVFSLD